jgi:hypothetical protein
MAAGTGSMAFLVWRKDDLRIGACQRRSWRQRVLQTFRIGPARRRRRLVILDHYAVDAATTASSRSV